jgi:inosose dehydratase
MRIGCFALIQPFTAMATQFRLIRELGLDNADITDNHDGATLGVEYGFSASVSLDSHPDKILRMAAEAGVRLSAFCAHANLLDPPSPDVYSTNQIIKAIRLAHLLGIRHVITTDGDPKTDFGHQLTHDQRIFAIRERLYEPIRWAEELDVELLIETHGPVTDNADSLAELLDALGHERTVGICLDTGNSWLGGADPIELIRRFASRIKHVHWKDMGAEWNDKRGTLYGCGMGMIPVGEGVVGIESIVRALREIGFDGDTTLEVAGADNVKASLRKLRSWLGLASRLPAEMVGCGSKI